MLHTFCVFSIFIISYCYLHVCVHTFCMFSSLMLFAWLCAGSSRPAGHLVDDADSLTIFVSNAMAYNCNLIFGLIYFILMIQLPIVSGPFCCYKWYSFSALEQVLGCSESEYCNRCNNSATKRVSFYKKQWYHFLVPYVLEFVVMSNVILNFGVKPGQLMKNSWKEKQQSMHCHLMVPLSCHVFSR